MAEPYIADKHNITTGIISKLNDAGIAKTTRDLNADIYTILINQPIDAIVFFDEKVKLICGVEDKKSKNINWSTYSSIRDLLYDLSLRKLRESEKYYFSNSRNCHILSL